MNIPEAVCNLPKYPVFVAPVHGGSVHTAPGDKDVVNVKFLLHKCTSKGEEGSSDGKTEEFLLREGEYDPLTKPALRSAALRSLVLRSLVLRSAALRSAALRSPVLRSLVLCSPALCTARFCTTLSCTVLSSAEVVAECCCEKVNTSIHQHCPYTNTAHTPALPIHQHCPSQHCPSRPCLCLAAAALLHLSPMRPHCVATAPAHYSCSPQYPPAHHSCALQLTSTLQVNTSHPSK